MPSCTSIDAKGKTSYSISFHGTVTSETFFDASTLLTWTCTALPSDPVASTFDPLLAKDFAAAGFVIHFPILVFVLACRLVLRVIFPRRYHID